MVQLTAVLKPVISHHPSVVPAVVPAVVPQPSVSQPQPPVGQPQLPVSWPQPPVSRLQPPVSQPQPPVSNANLIRHWVRLASASSIVRVLVYTRASTSASLRGAYAYARELLES